MAPVPVYTNSPVAAKPTGVTPQTAVPEQSPARDQPTSTAAASPTRPSYPPAQPGATPSLPAPTTAAQAYNPAEPTPTRKLSSDGPPPPQPGAFPTPTGARGPLPPPPKDGEKFQPPQPAAAPQTFAAYPEQMAVPSPTTAHPARQRGTSTATAPLGTTTYLGRAARLSGPSSPQNLQHPPGYQQNANASELDRYQRSAIEMSSSEEEGMWDTAKKWAGVAGEKLAAAESEVWKRLNKE